ncbi:FAD-dependent oxidoreductase [Streptomyces zaomyceticus]|uniref:FAD-dependent oxidoreductase n=1 Tax=Streptomyces zaomyceticus TaxID=68286 RepID=UPI0037138088
MADTSPRTAQPTARPARAVALTRTPAEALPPVPADALARTPAGASADASAHDADLIVIGGGPAGCAAARTAAGVGMRTILIEPDALCRNLYRIPALNNVLGGWTDGPALADAVTAELGSTDLCRLELGREATGVHADDEHVTVTLDTGTRLTAPHVVVATGVGPLQPHDVDWITAPGTRPLPPLWRATVRDAEARTLLVLGGDRAIGTFLRAQPDTETRLLVAYPEPDAYKVEEIRDDPRVTLLPTLRLTLSVSVSGRATADILGGDGGRRTVTADAAYLSIGNAPTAPPGDLVRGADGYCPPGEQHPRVIVAGDLRAARFQRIMTALGSGSEAALRAYYAARDLSAGR